VWSNHLQTGNNDSFITRGGHAQLFLSPQPQFRNLKEAIPQLQFRNCNSATFKEMLLRNRNTAIPQSQFFFKSTTLNPQVESFTSAIFGIFLAKESSLFMNTKIGGNKISCNCPFQESFVSRETNSSKNNFG
jgi:hypothetical protein